MSGNGPTSTVFEQTRARVCDGGLVQVLETFGDNWSMTATAVKSCGFKAQASSEGRWRALGLMHHRLQQIFVRSCWLESTRLGRVDNTAISHAIKGSHAHTDEIYYHDVCGENLSLTNQHLEILV